MSPTIYDLGIDKLSARDKLRLIGEIWDTLDPPEAVELSDAHWELIDARLDEADANPGVGYTWEEVMAHLRARR